MREPVTTRERSLLFLVTEDWYFAGHRLALARAAMAGGYGVSVATRISADMQTIAEAGVRTIAFGWSRGALSPLRLAAETWRLRRLLSGQDPDIVHAVSLRPILALALALLWAPRRRAVLAFTGLGYLFIGDALWKRMLRRLAARIVARAARRHDAVLLFENADDRDAIAALAGADLRMEVNPGSGYDAARFAVQPLPANPVPVFVFAGRMLKIKGVAELAAASARLAARGIAHEVLLAGPLDPVNRSGLSAAQIAAMTAGTPARWIGPAGDMAALWARADVAVAPSHGGEGVPLALVEAAACARPLIASDVPGCRDIAIDGETGLLVPPGDADALTDAMERLAGDAALRAEMGKAAARRARNFAGETVQARTLALYESLFSQ